MESVGEFFRQVRETKGLTIDEVASKTRIRTDFVKALEDGNFAKLPDQVFAKVEEAAAAGPCQQVAEENVHDDDRRADDPAHPGAGHSASVVGGANAHLTRRK